MSDLPDTVDDTNEDLAELRSNYQNLANELGSLKTVADDVGRLKAAFAPAPAPEQGNGAWWDDTFMQLLDADKRGQAMPLTARIGYQTHQNETRLAQVEAALREAKAELERVKNPVNRADQGTYARMDDLLTTNLEALYGEASPALHNAISSEIVDGIRYLQKNDPKQWEQVRRSETLQSRLVDWATRKVVPPGAVDAVAREVEAQTPVTVDTFEQAAQELQSLRGQIPEKQFQDLKVQLRQQMWEFKYNGQGKYNRGRRG